MVPKRRVIFGNTKDADASIQIGRIAGDSGYVADESFLHSFFRELKKGGTYELIDGLWLPGCCKKDAANKISKLYDLSKQKGTSFGTGGYYDASQSTAGLQQVLSRGDNKGNLVLNSGNLAAATWSGQELCTLSGNTLTFGTSATSRWQAGNPTSFPTPTPGRSYKIRVEAKGSSPFRLLYYGGTNSFSSDITPTGAYQWYEFQFDGQSGAPHYLSICNRSAGGVGSVDVRAVHVIESTWDSDYIPTTSAPAYAGLDGKPVVMFDATLGAAAGYLSGTIETKAQPITQFFICRKDGGGTTQRTIFSSGSNFGNNGTLNYYPSNTTRLEISAGLTVQSTTTQETWGQFTTLFNSASSTIRRKRIQIATGDSSNRDSALSYSIGCDRISTNPHNGPIAVVISVRQSLTTAQRDYIESVLNTFFPSTQ